MISILAFLILFALFGTQIMGFSLVAAIILLWMCGQYEILVLAAVALIAYWVHLWKEEKKEKENEQEKLEKDMRKWY
jgi:hypothetical protein